MASTTTTLLAFATEPPNLRLLDVLLGGGLLAALLGLVRLWFERRKIAADAELSYAQIVKEQLEQIDDLRTNLEDTIERCNRLQDELDHVKHRVRSARPGKHAGPGRAPKTDTTHSQQK